MTTDRKGRKLEIGDEVLIRAKISHVEGDQLRAGIVWQGGAPTDAHLPSISLSSRLTEVASDIPKEDARPASPAPRRHSHDQIVIALKILALPNPPLAMRDEAEAIVGAALIEPPPPSQTPKSSLTAADVLREYLRQHGAVSIG